MNPTRVGVRAWPRAGVDEPYEGDIENYVDFQTQGYVFKSNTRSGWHFDPIKLMELQSTHVKSDYVGSEMAERKIQ